jgi:hypothetical protein
MGDAELGALNKECCTQNTQHGTHLLPLRITIEYPMEELRKYYPCHAEVLRR